jgi:hypothetical protein
MRTKYQPRNIRGREHLTYLGVDGNITLKSILAGCGSVDWLGAGCGSMVTFVNTALCLEDGAACSSETSITFCHTIL